jgi:hypothetical protein
MDEVTRLIPEQRYAFDVDVGTTHLMVAISSSDDWLDRAAGWGLR